MKNLCLLFIIILINFNCKSQQEETTFLFPIKENNKIGFIDNHGNLIIKPIFRNVGQFSEGLAAARINGTFGFIDRKGDFAIAPKYDYATEFREGLAIVYDNGSPQFIDKQGNIPFTINYKETSLFKNESAIVQTVTSKFGIINKSGVLIADTIFSNIRRNDNDLFLVEKRNNDKETYGIIDKNGKFIVPMDKYESIDSYKEGIIKAYNYQDDNDRVTFLDTNGKVIFSKQLSLKDGFILEDFQNNFAIITLHQRSEDEDNYSSQNKYEGYINIKGEVVLNDTLIEDLTNFNDNRAFAKYKDDKFYMINEQMKKVNVQGFDEVNEFENGSAIVKIDGKGFGVVNKNGDFIVEPKFEEISPYTGIIDDYFFFSKASPTKEDAYRTLYGVANLKGEIVIEPLFEDYDFNGFQNGLLKVRIGKYQSYIDKKGEIIWQEKQNTIIEDVNIDYMKRGYFYAHSPVDEKDLSGFGISENSAKKIENKGQITDNELNIKIDNAIVFDQNKWNCHSVFINNTTSKSVKFNASDSRLYMKVQAKTMNNEWKDIEYLPSSFCGNSLHILTLNSGEYWEFLMPKYSGDFKTKLRIELKYIDPENENGKWYSRATDLTIYSNEFDGSINKSQFWRKEKYFSNGFMDPYFD
jgi:hypothetical protein